MDAAGLWMSAARTFTFGSFVFMPERQLLLQGERGVRVGCRALDVLAALVEQPGELVTKDALMARAWPNTTVGEGNLKVTMAALRRALGDDASAARYIATVTGRGYRFITPVATTGCAGGPAALTGDVRGDQTLVDAVVIDGGILIRIEGRAVQISLDGRPRRMLLIELGGQDEAWMRAALPPR